MSGLQNRGSEASSQIGDLRIKSIAPREQAVCLKLPAGMVEFALGIREILGQAMHHGVMGTREIQLPRDRGLGITTLPFLYLSFLGHPLHHSNLKIGPLPW